MPHMHASTLSGFPPHAVGLEEEALMAPAFLSASGPLPHPTHHYHMQQQQQHAAYAQTVGVLPWMKAKAKTSLGSAGMASYYKHQEDKRLARLRGVKSVIVAKHYNKLHPAAAKCLPELEARHSRRPPWAVSDGSPSPSNAVPVDALPPGGKALYSAEDFWKDVAPPPQAVHGHGMGGYASSLDLMEIEDAKAHTRRLAHQAPPKPHAPKARKPKRGRRRSDGDPPLQAATYLGPPLGLGSVGPLEGGEGAHYDDMDTLGHGLSMDHIVPLPHTTQQQDTLEASPRGVLDGPSSLESLSFPPDPSLAAGVLVGSEGSGVGVESSSVGLGAESSVLLMSEGLMTVQQAMATLRDMAPPTLSDTHPHEASDEAYEDDYDDSHDKEKSQGPTEGDVSPPRRRRRRRRASTKGQGLVLPAVALSATMSSTLHSHCNDPSASPCPRCRCKAQEGLAATVSCLLPPKAFAKRRASMPIARSKASSDKKKSSKDVLSAKAPTKDHLEQDDPQLSLLLSQLQRLTSADRKALIAALRHKPLPHHDSSQHVEVEEETVGCSKEGQAEATALGASTTVRGRLYMGRRTDPKPHSLKHLTLHTSHKALSPHRHPPSAVASPKAHPPKPSKPSKPHEGDEAEAHYEDDFHDHDDNDDTHQHHHNKHTPKHHNKSSPKPHRHIANKASPHPTH